MDTRGNIRAFENEREAIREGFTEMLTDQEVEYLIAIPKDMRAEALKNYRKSNSNKTDPTCPRQQDAMQKLKEKLLARTDKKVRATKPTRDIKQEKKNKKIAKKSKQKNRGR